MNNKKEYLIPFILVTSLFFLWAFLHNLNPILIPHLKKACQLTDTQSALIDSAVYLGYFIMAIPAGLFMHKYGYKNGILIGLALYAVGALLFYPAAGARSYTMFLTALFIIASGATFLETVANPYITKLGDPATSEQRLNFAQSFNGVGAFLAPIIGGQVILSGIEKSKEELQSMTPDALNTYLMSESSTVKIPYLIMAGVVLLVALFFMASKIPEIKEVDSSDTNHTFSLNVFRHSHVLWAVIAQFFYVGAQVCVGSFFIRLTHYLVGMNEKNAAFLWGSVAMLGFLVGRFAGTWFMKFIAPARLLALYCLINIVLLAIALTTKGMVTVYAVAAVPFFMSIMFPTIFALGIKGLGEETKIASSFLVMAIFGGAIFPLMMGQISDRTGSIQKAYIIPLICFVFIWFFAQYKYRPKFR
ncbi:MAG: L-fucose:H+ symporter permease [Saprospiraceae bacterium]